MTRRLVRVCAAALALLVALAPAPVSTAYAAGPATPLPSDRLHFGLANGPGSLSWMTSSGVPWRYRYTYLAGGLYNNPWPTWQDPALPPGQYALDYMTNSSAHGYTPVLPYYMLLQSHRASDEATDDFDNLNNATLMRDYYANWSLLMHKAGQYGGQVVIHVEPDLWGYLQQRSGNGVASALTAAVNSSGYADAGAYPNTVTGFAQALQHMRDLYAPNALLAWHASMWSSSIDIASSTDPGLNAAAEADKTAAFFNSASPAGWDLVFNDVDDHDAGWWENASCGSPPCVNAGFTHWWDPSNAAFPNFTRYLGWVSELHARTARPQVAWQVPVGNQYFLTENNTCGHYQDNVAPYFIGHAPDLYAAGLVAVLFGAGNGCQTTNEDTQGDGVTNNNGMATTDQLGRCNACNTHTSTVADDDGGYLRIFVGQYYASPFGVPGAPASVSATAGDGSATVSWQAPGGGSSAITSYQVTASPGGAQVTVGAAATSATVTGLTNGTTYTFAVAARNANGTGPAAVSNAVIPFAPTWTGYFSWYDLNSAGMWQDNIHLVNPGSSPVSGSVHLPGMNALPFNVAGGAETYVHFPPGTIGGPVRVSASGRVIASQRVTYASSFNEVAAQLPGAAATSLWIGWFDSRSAGMYHDNIHVLNPGGSTAHVQVSMPGQSFMLAVDPGQQAYGTFAAGSIGGPIHIQSDQPVLASQRLTYLQSFNEVPARPDPSPSDPTDTWFNWYDLASPGMYRDDVHVLNTSPTATATGTVRIPELGLSQPFTVAPLGDATISFPRGTIGGPVEVSSSIPVLTTQRVTYLDSLNEVLGRSSAQAANTSYVNWFDRQSAGMYVDNVHVLNPGTAPASVTIALGGQSLPPFSLAAGAEAYRSFAAGTIGGPITITSTGAPVLASARVTYLDSFNELSAQP